MNTFQNPFWPGDFADPFLLKVRGRYYAYATEPVERPAAGTPIFPILTSDDLVTWRRAGHALPALGEPYFRYWAPEVTEHNGQFLFYYAVHTEPFTAAIRVAIAEHPAGPFQDSGHDLTSGMFTWAIDPHVFRDQDGQWYLYFTTEYLETETGLVGSGNVVDRLLDPFTLAGTPARVTPPRHAWQLFEAKRAEKGGVDWYCVEGPTVLRHRTRYYEMFSGGCYYRDNYAISYATAPAPMGPGGMQDASWEDRATEEAGVLMHGRPGMLVSPGHNSLVLAPNNVDLYIAYHAWPADRSGRYPCLDRLHWHGDTMWTPGPSLTPQPAPPMPRLTELFQHEHLAAAWSSGAGRWEVSQDAVTQGHAQAEIATLAHTASLGPAWVLEVNARHITGNGAYGVLLHAADGGGVAVLIEPSTHQLSLRQARQDTRQRESSSGRAEISSAPVGPRLAAIAAVDLPGGFRVDAWHQLLITHAGRVLNVRLDGLPALQVECGSLSGALALYTEHCSAAFSSLALTDHFTDEFLDPRQTLAGLGWYEPGIAAKTGSDSAGPAPRLCADRSDAWHLQDGLLVQQDAGSERILLKGASLHNVELGTTLRLLEDGAGAVPRLGVILMPDFPSPAGAAAAHTSPAPPEPPPDSPDAHKPVIVVLARHGAEWRLQVEHSGTEPRVLEAMPLPVPFAGRDWHTLRLTMRQGMLTVHLDGPDRLAIPVPPVAYICGLFTAQAACAFLRVWQTGVPPDGSPARGEDCT